MSAFLPQFDPDPTARATARDAARLKYQFNYTFVSPLAVIDRVPREHEFSHEWLKVVGDRILFVLSNRIDLEGKTEFSEYLRSKHSLLTKAIAWGAELFLGVLREMVTDSLKFTLRSTARPDRPTALSAYSDLFRSIGLPPISATIPSDPAFAHMRVAGPNPVMLQRIRALDDRLPLTEAEYQRVVPGDSLAAAGAEGRLFLADYQPLHGAVMGTYPHDVQKYVYAPLALFVTDRTTRQLRPVAIQCKQTPGPDNPVFTPDDGHNWLIAKTVVEIADGNFHEAVTHLARTHLLIEPFVICTYRQLAPNHPLFVLLAPHFDGTLAINDASWRHLIANKGAVDQLFGGTIETSRQLAASGVQSYLFNESMLPKALADRGTDSAETLPEYHYRDDARLYWDAIQKWVSDYLALYYPTDGEVQSDPELKAWLAEIGADTGGRVSGFGVGTAAPTRAYLIDAVTMILFTCSVQHAAVNFPQYDVMSYVPAMPLAGYSPAPTSKTGATPADHLAMFPPMDMAELQMELGYMLGTVHYTTLGEYPANYFLDPRVAEPLTQFQKQLAEIGRTIEQRNTTRLPYHTLSPSGIPQSINI
ncbi:Linoleate 9/13-lipoxygenase precursor [Gemmata sp. SH-PL17]|uniref:lipoxygenase family protein n=1 Tax=Gemmata sp. SH-PL17 TaxID=1630693 RepID=UPI00078CCCE3|nr:lipoxygenase family protein [Gemmata sp. SH-PL17]AMV24978.1 Linoleate 9/13-lipoxygenase precursor [Gemmata sp. SH-PL17]